MDNRKFQVGDIVKRNKFRPDYILDFHIGIVSSVSKIEGFEKDFIHVLNIKTNRIFFACIDYLEKVII